MAIKVLKQKQSNGLFNTYEIGAAARNVEVQVGTEVKTLQYMIDNGEIGGGGSGGGGGGDTPSAPAAWVDIY